MRARTRAPPAMWQKLLLATAPTNVAHATGRAGPSRNLTPHALDRAGTLHHICQALSKTLMNPELQDTRVVYYTSQDPRDVTNSICLLGAYLCLRLGASPQEAWQPFQALRETPNGPMCLPHRDATWVKSPYDLDVMDVWAGLLRAVGAGLYDMRNFDKHEVTRPLCCFVSMSSSALWRSDVGI